MAKPTLADPASSEKWAEWERADASKEPSARLRAIVARYRKHNDAVEAALDARELDAANPRKQ